MSATRPPVAAAFDARAEAKRLLRVARTGALATLETASGAPLTTLVSVATDYDGSPVLLLSSLSQHTRNLAGDARGSLLLTSPPGRGDPLNQPRLTIGGAIAAHPDPGARARFLARNPKSKLYASFADFSMYRLEIAATHFNGGFGRAAVLNPAEILTDLTAADALIEAEADLLAEVNLGDAVVLAMLAGDRKRRWRAIGLDPEGLDLAAGAQTARVSFPRVTPTPLAWRKALDASLKERAV